MNDDICPGFMGDPDCHPCECGDHEHCNPGLTPQEAAAIEWPQLDEE